MKKYKNLLFALKHTSNPTQCTYPSIFYDYLNYVEPQQHKISDNVCVCMLSSFCSMQADGP